MSSVCMFLLYQSGPPSANYTSNPRVILSHPQVFKKADYYVTTIDNNNYVSVNDVYVNEEKETYYCGKTKDATGAREA